MVRGLLNQAFKDALVQGVIEQNPVANSTPYLRRKPSVKVLSRDKIKVMLTVASTTNEDWYLEILLGLFGGLRKGEILGLKFKDVDFEKGTISIKRQITANPIVEKGGYKIED